MLTKYFDAFVYVANWGTHRLMFRFPRRAVDVDALTSYVLDECVDVKAHQDVVVLDLTINLEESPGGWEEGEGWLDELLPLREDILAGDYRALYLAWLAGVSRFFPSDYEGDDEEDEYAEQQEPPVPPGLRQLTPALKKLAEFFWLDQDLLAVAAQASATATPAVSPRASWRGGWPGCPPGKRTPLLVRFLGGEAGAIRLELLKRLRDESKKRSGVGATPPARRTVREMLAARGEQRRQRLSGEAQAGGRARAAGAKRRRSERSTSTRWPASRRRHGRWPRT